MRVEHTIRVGISLRDNGSLVVPCLSKIFVGVIFDLDVVAVLAQTVLKVHHLHKRREALIQPDIPPIFAGD